MFAMAMVVVVYAQSIMPIHTTVSNLQVAMLGTVVIFELWNKDGIKTRGDKIGMHDVRFK